MKLSELQNILLEELQFLLADWKFVKGKRQFQKADEGFVWYLHVGFINHLEDFDAVADVAVELKAGKDRLCIVGAEIGNIEGTGQRRFRVSNRRAAKSSAVELYEHFNERGLPFLRKYSDPAEVVGTLRNGGEEAMLISPFLNQHQDQINRLSSHYGIGM